jgi:hypothetical protein
MHCLPGSDFCKISLAIAGAEGEKRIAEAKPRRVSLEKGICPRSSGSASRPERADTGPHR